MNNSVIKRQYTQPMPTKQSGFSLIEALVAFMIISVGMLGIASLQTISMKAGHTAILRTSAVFNVQDILDRMRSNTTQIAAYAVDAAGMGTDGGCNVAQRLNTALDSYIDSRAFTVRWQMATPNTNPISTIAISSTTSSS